MFHRLPVTARAHRHRLLLNPMRLLVLLVCVLFGPLLYHVIFVRPTDYGEHLSFVSRLIATGDINSFLMPNWLYEFLVLAIWKVVPVGPVDGVRVAGWLAGLLGYVAGAIAVFRYLRFSLGRRGPGDTGVALLSLCLLIVTPISMLTWSQSSFYLGYIGINVFHSPSMVLLKPLALLLYWLSVSLLEGTGPRLQPRWRVWAVTLSVLAILAKPSYAICFLPALALVVLFRRFSGARPGLGWRDLFCWIVAPSAIVLVTQFYWRFLDPPSHDTKGPLVFAPLSAMQFHSDWLLLKFCMSVAFPAAVYLGAFRQARRSSRLNFCWLCFAFAVSYLYLLAEGGARLNQLNFGWSGQITLFLLFVESTTFYLSQGSLRGRRPVWSRICFALFALHLLSGLGYMAAIYTDYSELDFRTGLRASGPGAELARTGR